MLRKGINILLMRSRNSQQTVCCSQITRVFSSRNEEDTSCLDSAVSQCKAGCSTIRYQIVHPGKVSPRRLVPDHIQRPSYALDSALSRFVHKSWLASKFSSEIKSEEQIRVMRDACRYDSCCCLLLVVSGGSTTDSVHLM